MKHFFIAVLCALLPVLTVSGQDNWVQARFPDPDKSYDTPTLSLPEGMADYGRIMAWLEDRSARDPRMAVEIVGTSTGGLPVPLVHLSDGRGGNKLKVWFQGAIHGNEPAGAEGLFALIDRLREDPSVLRHADLYILPVANMDGYLAGKRVSASGLDLNRDQTKFADPMSAKLKEWFFRVSPDVAVDFHEYNPVRKELSARGLISYYDVMFLPTGHPAVPAVLRKAVVDHLVAPARKALDGEGYSYCNYFTINSSGDELALVMGARSPQSSSTSYSLSGAVSMLVEIRGIGMGRTALARRTHAAGTIAWSILEEVNAHPQAFRKACRRARKEVLRGKTPVVAAFHSREVRQDMTFLETATGQKRVLEQMLVRDALQSEADLVRERPAAYIVEASEERAIANLRTLGLEVEILPVPRELEVESYEVVSCEEDPVLWEKIHRQTVTTRTFLRKKVFPAGSALVRVRQPCGAGAVAVLEPESENGFVRFRVIEAAPGAILPVSRVKTITY